MNSGFVGWCFWFWPASSVNTTHIQTVPYLQRQSFQRQQYFKKNTHACDCTNPLRSHCNGRERWWSSRELKNNTNARKGMETHQDNQPDDWRLLVSFICSGVPSALPKAGGFNLLPVLNSSPGCFHVKQSFTITVRKAELLRPNNSIQALHHSVWTLLVHSLHLLWRVNVGALLHVICYNTEANYNTTSMLMLNRPRAGKSAEEIPKQKESENPTHVTNIHCRKHFFADELERPCGQ